MSTTSAGSWRHFNNHPGLVQSAQFSPDGTHLIVYCCDSTIHVWDRALMLECHRFDRPICDVAFVPNTRTALSAALDGAVILWDTATWKPLRHYKHHRGAVRSIAVSADGRVAISGGEDGVLCMWEIAEHGEVLRLDADSEDLAGVSISPSGSRAFSAGFGGSLHFWDRRKRHELTPVHTFMDEAWGAIFSPDERFVFAYGSAERIVYDIEDKRLIDAPFQNQSVLTHDRWPPYSHGMSSIAFVPGERLLVGHNSGLFLWDLGRVELIQRFDFPSSSTRCVAASRGGRQVLSGGNDGVRIWHVDGHQIDHRPSSSGYINSIAISSCGSLALMAETTLAPVPIGACDLAPEIRGTSIYTCSLLGEEP